MCITMRKHFIHLWFNKNQYHKSSKLFLHWDTYPATFKRWVSWCQSKIRSPEKDQRLPKTYRKNIKLDIYFPYYYYYYYYHHYYYYNSYYYLKFLTWTRSHRNTKQLVNQQEKNLLGVLPWCDRNRIYRGCSLGLECKITKHENVKHEINYWKVTSKKPAK